MIKKPKSILSETKWKAGHKFNIHLKVVHAKFAGDTHHLAKAQRGSLAETSVDTSFAIHGNFNYRRSESSDKSI